MGNFGAITVLLQTRLRAVGGATGTGGGSGGQILYSRLRSAFSNSYATGGDTLAVGTYYSPGSIIDANVARENTTSGYLYRTIVQAIPNDLSLLIIAMNPTRVHRHVLRFQTVAAANAVTAAANQLRTAAAAFDVAGVADNTGEGGVVDNAAASGTQVANTTDLSAVTVVVEVWGRAS